MSPLALALLVSASPATGDGCRLLDVHGAMGPALSRRSDNLETERSWTLGLGAGADLNDCWSWPLRAELALMTGTAGGEEGVHDVMVSSWTTHVMLLVGASWAPFRRESVSLGIELLAGPDLRFTRVTYEIQREEHATTGMEVIAGITGGGFVRLRRWRLTMRLLGGVPGGRALSFLTSAGYRF